jgi:DNA-binding LacI/PurR family transcriptional regulator
VPDDVSVVGFDDGEEVGYYNPPLTTIRQDFRAVGRRGIEMLVAQIESGERAAEQAMIEPELVVRRSTGPCRS